MAVRAGRFEGHLEPGLYLRRPGHRAPNSRLQAEAGARADVGVSFCVQGLRRSEGTALQVGGSRQVWTVKTECSTEPGQSCASWGAGGAPGLCSRWTLCSEPTRGLGVQGGALAILRGDRAAHGARGAVTVAPPHHPRASPAPPRIGCFVSFAFPSCAAGHSRLAGNLRHSQVDGSAWSPPRCHLGPGLLLMHALKCYHVGMTGDQGLHRTSGFCSPRFPPRDAGRCPAPARMHLHSRSCRSHPPPARTCTPGSAAAPCPARCPSGTPAWTGWPPPWTRRSAPATRPPRTGRRPRWPPWLPSGSSLSRSAPWTCSAAVKERVHGTELKAGPHGPKENWRHEACLGLTPGGGAKGDPRGGKQVRTPCNTSAVGAEGPGAGRTRVCDSAGHGRPWSSAADLCVCLCACGAEDVTRSKMK